VKIREKEIVSKIFYGFYKVKVAKSPVIPSFFAGILSFPPIPLLPLENG
jgi:hypothetical protein